MYNNKLNTSTFNSETQELLDSKPVEVGRNGTRAYKLAGGEVFKKQLDKRIEETGIHNMNGAGVELFYYYLLEEMGFGPKVNVGRDANNKEYILTDGVPNFLSAKKIRDFTNGLTSQEKNNILFNSGDEKNNTLAQLTKLELLARLMKLSDITFNLDNTGLELNAAKKIVRPVIIDFQTDPIFKTTNNNREDYCSQYPVGMTLDGHYSPVTPMSQYALLPLFQSCGLEREARENLEPLQEKALKEMFGVQEGKEVSKFTEAILNAKAKTLFAEPTEESAKGVNMAIESLMVRGFPKFNIIEHVAKEINSNIKKEIKEVLTENESKKVDVFNVSRSPSPVTPNIQPKPTKPGVQPEPTKPGVQPKPKKPGTSQRSLSLF